MKAVTYSHYGPPEVLELREIDRPVPEPREVLVRVCAVEATKADCEMRGFTFPAKWFRLPLRLIFGIRRPRRPVLGMYYSGEVATVGARVRDLKPGDAVFGTTGFGLGAYAEYVAAAGTLAIKPANMSFAEAAAVPLGGLNALHFLRLAKLVAGESLLINGAGGSIGTHAIQIAKAIGAHVSCVDRGDKEAALRRLGADEFIDYTKRDFADDGKLYDVVFDMVFARSFTAGIRSLKPGGRYVSGNPSLAVILRSLMLSVLTDKSARFAFAAESKEELETLRAMIEAGQIRSIVDRILPLDAAVEAHRLVEAERRNGAIVLDCRFDSP